MVEIYKNAIPVMDVMHEWYKESYGYGAMIPFIGVVRADDSIEALRFDLHETMLNGWFSRHKHQSDTKILMAHSKGDVKVGQTSFMAAVFSKHREEGFGEIEKFVEAFKAHAPIWKFDVIEGQAHYAKDRSKPLPNSGILAL